MCTVSAMGVNLAYTNIGIGGIGKTYTSYLV